MKTLQIITNKGHPNNPNIVCILTATATRRSWNALGRGDAELRVVVQHLLDKVQEVQVVLLCVTLLPPPPAIGPSLQCVDSEDHALRGVVGKRGGQGASMLFTLEPQKNPSPPFLH